MRRLVAVAALLAAALPVPALGTGPREAAHAGAWAARYREAARGLPVTSLLDAADASASSYTIEFTTLVPAGDLDGDGAGDVADVHLRETYGPSGTESVTLYVEARRGRDGALLWKHSVGDGRVFPYVFFAPVGAGGRPGMVTVTTTADVLGQADAWAGRATSTVAAFDGAGRRIWTYDAGLAGGGAQDVYAFTDVRPVGTGALVAGRATDLLLEGYTFVGAFDPIGVVGMYGELVQRRVLDGATGTVRDLGPVSPTVGGEATTATVVGDVDGDRLDDVAYVDAETSGATLRVLRSSDGTEHSATALPRGDYHYPHRAPDVTGDGRADVLVLGYAYDDDRALMSLADVARGRIAWTRPAANEVFFPGDVDRRPGAEIVMAEAGLVSDGRGFRLTAVDGAGRSVWSVTRILRKTGPPDRSHMSVEAAGDVNGDGVGDIRYSMASAPGVPPRRDDGLVDGRTGRVRSGLPAALASVGALDGRGADAVAGTIANGGVTIAAFRGDGSARLWRTTLPDRGLIRTDAVSVDRDRCADVAVTVTGTRLTTYVLSGATGAPLWALTRKNGSPGVVSRPKPLSTHRFARTC